MNVPNFDMQYLKQLFDELNLSFKDQAKSLKDLEKSAAGMVITLSNIEKRNAEQDNTLKEHEGKIRELERKHDQCNAQGQLKGMWKHIERLNAYMDLQRKDDDKYDTGMIDAHAQRLQHAAEMAALTKKADVPFRDAALKMAPWLILTFAFGLVLATLVVIQVVTGQKVVP